MRPVALQVTILSDDTRDEAPERIRMEVQRSLALWLNPENVTVALALAEIISETRSA